MRGANHRLARQTLFDFVGFALASGSQLGWELAQRATELDEELLASVARRSPVLTAGAA